MYFIYNVLICLAGFFVKLSAQFSRKMKLFSDGRRNVTDVILNDIAPSDKVIWFHAASLGEYEQGLPVMEAVREAYPGYKILLTFFSPSGYEVRKNNVVADVTVYLPLDTRQNVRKFLDAAHPEIAIFIKYEYWPNYLNELKQRNIDTYLVSGIFRENQVFFKWYGGFYRRALTTFKHFFVQNEKSAALLRKLGVNHVTVSGDTRFDRVAAILNRDNSLDFMEEFKDSKLLVVAGSTWPKDETLLADFINRCDAKVKFLFAPHNIKPEQIAGLKALLKKKTVLFSEKDGADLADFDVMIVDTIGILTKVYSYADVAYVGGGFGNPGVHNVLEPATFGVPVVIGPNYSHFAEATALVERDGCVSIGDQQSLDAALLRLIHGENDRRKTGEICRAFIEENRHATKIIMDFLARRRNLQTSKPTKNEN